MRETGENNRLLRNSADNSDMGHEQCAGNSSRHWRWTNGHPWDIPERGQITEKFLCVGQPRNVIRMTGSSLLCVQIQNKLRRCGTSAETSAEICASIFPLVLLSCLCSAECLLGCRETSSEEKLACKSQADCSCMS